MVAAACAAVLAVAVPVRAQEATTADESVRFLPRYEFHIAAEYLTVNDPRLGWEAHYGGALDVVSYPGGRVTFTADYGVILGDQIRVFDPNQSRYLLEMTVTRRVGGTEIGGLFHHVSRHLSDRAKIVPIDWNMVGVRVQSAGEEGRMRVEARADLRAVVQRSTVDYQWELVADTVTRYAVGPHAGVFLRSDLRVLGVDGSADRGTQAGLRAEGGVSVEGEAGVLELFAAIEHRVDPVPFVQERVTWAGLGFRLVGR